MVLNNIFFGIWRTWLWIGILSGLILFSPITIIVINSSKTYWIFHTFCKYWCRLVLILNGFYYRIKSECIIDPQESYIICPNHTSKFDIILLFATFPNTFVFMGKKNVSNIRLFEWFYEKTMITFERGSVASAVSAYRKADRLLKEKTSIVIFPEGEVPKQNIRLQSFKLGAFKLAIANKVPIIPLTFVDNKNKYPEDKLNIKLGCLRVFVHSPIATSKMTIKNCKKLRDITFNKIDQTLIYYENKKRKN